MVLDLARIASDKFEINLNEIDIREELTEIYNNFKGAVSLKKINFRLEFLDETRFVNTDSGILKVIIENLVNNAIKFTKAGKITIESKTLIENKNKFLLISVKDTGIGIKPNEIQIIFKEFKQLSEGTLKDFQGTGLGLSISKKFTEHLNGKLLVESEFGIGSTFTIKLPII
jgi:signal transduction histidine kinase